MGRAHCPPSPAITLPPRRPQSSRVGPPGMEALSVVQTSLRFTTPYAGSSTRPTLPAVPGPGLPCQRVLRSTRTGIAFLRHQQQYRIVQFFRVVEHAQQQWISDQLQRHPDLDRRRGQSLPVDDARRSDQILCIDPDLRSPEVGPVTATPTNSSGPSSSTTCLVFARPRRAVTPISAASAHPIMLPATVSISSGEQRASLLRPQHRNT